MDFEALALLDNPVEYWKLEEASGDFITNVDGGFDATPNGGTAGPGILTRAVSCAVCNGIRTVDSLPPRRRFFATQRTFDGTLFIDNWTIEQFIKVTEPTAMTIPVGLNGLTADDKFLVNAIHGESWGDQTIGIGVQVGTNGVVLRQHSNSNLQPASYFLLDDYLSTEEFTHLVITCTREGNVRTLRIYINGVYAGDIEGGIYEEWSISGWVVGAWPSYGQTNLNVSLDYYYGYNFDGWVDEVVWYDYPLTASQVSNHYNAFRATNISPVDHFITPSLGAEFTVGSPIQISWEPSPEANGYILEFWNGSSYQLVGNTTNSNRLWSVPNLVGDGYHFRVTSTFDGYTPSELCGGSPTLSDNFSIVAAPPPPEPEITPCIVIEPTISNYDTLPQDIPVFIGGGCGNDASEDVPTNTEENQGLNITFNPCS